MLHVGKFDFEQNGDTVYLSLEQTEATIYGAHSEHWELRRVLVDLKEQGKTVGCPEEVYKALIARDWFKKEPVGNFMCAMGIYSDVRLNQIIHKYGLSENHLPAIDAIINMRDGLLRADKYVKQQQNRLETLRLKNQVS
ncbi:MAG: hypothetical protein KAI53_01900 [Candidatus Aenigmarchaeota archaeon]|nr:hypothetical protein [Candidatus Aenigmarchaeota archaeon]